MHYIIRRQTGRHTEYLNTSNQLWKWTRNIGAADRFRDEAEALSLANDWQDYFHSKGYDSGIDLLAEQGDLAPEGTIR